MWALMSVHMDSYEHIQYMHLLSIMFFVFLFGRMVRAVFSHLLF